MQTQSVSDAEKGLRLLTNFLNETTLINRGGRESGLTANGRVAISQSGHAIGMALNQLKETTKALEEKESALQSATTELAALREQVKAKPKRK